MNRFAGISFISVFALASANAGDPLQIPEGHTVSRATIKAYAKGKPKSEVILNTQADLRFVVDHLKGLRSSMYDHSLPQLDLIVQFSDGSYTRLRISEHEIGPSAPASAWNRHWFPKDSSLFQFLMAKAYPNPGN